MRAILTLALALVLSGCSDDLSTQRVLRQAGFTDIHTMGYDFFACGDDDWYSTSFTAKNPQGDLVSGTVCCGLMFKGCTIRW